eukprot:2713908-Prymnesium_polylepis.1
MLQTSATRPRSGGCLSTRSNSSPHATRVPWRILIVHGTAKCKLRRGLQSEVFRLFDAVAEAAVRT